MRTLISLHFFVDGLRMKASERAVSEVFATLRERGAHATAGPLPSVGARVRRI